MSDPVIEDPPVRDLPPSRLSRVMRSVGYFLAGIAGILLLIKAPAAVDDKVLVIVGKAIGVFLMSGFVASVGAFRYKYRSEYYCLPAIMGSILVVIVCMLAYAATHEGTGIFLAFISAFLFCKLVARFADLHRLVTSYKVRGG